MGWLGQGLPPRCHFWVKMGQIRPPGGDFCWELGWIPLGSGSQFSSWCWELLPPSPSPVPVEFWALPGFPPREFFCVWGQILSDLKLPPFPKSAFSRCLDFFGIPRRSPAVPLLLPSFSSPFFWGKIPDFPPPSGTLRGREEPLPPQLWSSPSWGIFIFFFFPPFYFQADPVPLGSSPLPFPPPSRFPGFWWIWDFPVGVTELIRDIFG